MVDTLSESGIAVGSTGLEFRGDDADCHGLAHSGYGGKFRLECSDAGRGRKREGRRVKCVNASRPVRLHAFDRDTVDDRWRRREDEKCVVHGAFKITTSMRRARRPRFEAQWRLIMAA